MVSTFEKVSCSFLRYVRGTTNPPKSIYTWSRKKYGYREDLIRYWLKKYKNVSIGKYTYGWQNMSPFDMIASIGAFTSIGKNILLIPNTHNIHYVTTSPILTNPSFHIMNTMSHKERYPVRSIRIGNDVWIGSNSMIFQDVTIGDGAVIGAGSIVRKDVPPYAVIINTDQILKYRFDKEICRKLLEIKWWDWEDNKIKKEIDNLYNINRFINSLEIS